MEIEVNVGNMVFESRTRISNVVNTHIGTLILKQVIRGSKPTRTRTQKQRKPKKQPKVECR
jgi:hypothetical protein